MKLSLVYQNFVAAKSTPAVAGGQSELIDPVTEEPYANTALSTADDVNVAFAAAGEAFIDVWRGISPAERQFALTNDTEFSLASSIWTTDHECALPMSRALEFGCVWINTHAPVIGEMLHGGFRHSGYGKDLSMYSLEEYTRVKHVMSSITPARAK
jgi:acyl-CoA reductase-like NAD-dependent aldehyde dehydrogenase